MMAGACSEATSTGSDEPEAAPEPETSIVTGPIMVDRSNYQQAEVARKFNKWASRGANNKLMHMTALEPFSGMKIPKINIGEEKWNGATYSALKSQFRIEWQTYLDPFGALGWGRESYTKEELLRFAGRCRQD